MNSDIFVDTRGWYAAMSQIYGCFFENKW